jgi:cellulose synthase (UDP-forming)
MTRIVSRIAGAVGLLVALAMLAVVVTTPLDVRPQLIVGLTVVGLAVLLRRSRRPLVTQILVVLSVVASSRYIWWRITATLDFDTTADRVFGDLLLVAELYAFVVLLLGAFQTVQVLHRRPVPLPADRSTWPTVDIYIPSYNEPLEVVRPTVLAALALDWPRDKLRVHLLDDGKRRDFRAFAEKARVNYIVRADNKHAKAGNLNHAMKITHGDLIAIFDCDHVVARSFLQLTVGWFLRDQRLAMLQTPHHFYNADPIERNTRQFRRIPNEGELFYGYVQGGNDFWNATFFCGSCAVLRRCALEQVGGIATDSVTEDALTSLKLQRLGWSTAYLGIRQAGGLATDTLAAHIGQRIRWAQGMAQILRVSNPLWGRGLRIGQRLCYLNAILHFFYGLPRLVFLVGPLAFLLFGAHVCNTSPAMLVAYLVPHLAHAMLVDGRTKGRFRYAFWNNVYETVLAIYILVPTLVAVIRPRASVFKVTDKGVMIEQGGFDRKVARPYLLLLLFTLAGVVFAGMRLFLWDYYDPGTVLLNLSWTLFSVVTLGSVLRVACETRQLRRTHRIPLKLRAMVRSASGHTCTAETRDLSLGGGSVRLDDAFALAVGDAIDVSVFLHERERSFPARVVACDGDLLHLSWQPLSLRQESDVVDLLFGRPDAWLDWDRDRPPDRPFSSLRTLVRESGQGLRKVIAAERRIVSGAGAGIAVAAACFLLIHTGWRVAPIVDRFSAIGSRIAGALASVTEGR